MKANNERMKELTKEMVWSRMNFILEQMEENPYIFNRTIDEVRDFLWETSNWTTESNPYGITYKEYVSMWNCAKENHRIREYISKERAMGFYKDLKGKLYDGDTNHVDTCSLTAEGAAEKLGIDVDTVRDFYLALKVHRVTERQGRGLVF